MIKFYIERVTRMLYTVFFAGIGISVGEYFGQDNGAVIGAVIGTLVAMYFVFSSSEPHTTKQEVPMIDRRHISRRKRKHRSRK